MDFRILNHPCIPGIKPTWSGWMIAISLTTKMVPTFDGKQKRKLDKYIYDLGSCTFCQLCVTSCPQDALEFKNDFEQAVFTREKLVKKLNYLPEKEEPAPTPEQIAKMQAEKEAKIAAAKAAAAAKKAAMAAAGGAPAAAPAPAKADAPDTKTAEGNK